jgi:hypothetical protein
MSEFTRNADDPRHCRLCGEWDPGWPESMDWYVVEHEGIDRRVCPLCQQSIGHGHAAPSRREAQGPTARRRTPGLKTIAQRQRRAARHRL